MRVIAGSMKGRRLRVPRGRGTRPMTQRVREALFMVLMTLGVEPERVLDLYAGSGGIGIEALSRGAAWCDFVEQNGAACAVIRANLEATRFSDRAAVHQTTVQAYLPRVTEPYDLIVMDPPYADPRILETMALVGESRAVADGTVLALGHWPRLEVPETLGPWRQLRHRCHGDSCFTIYEAVLPPEGADGGPTEG